MAYKPKLQRAYCYSLNISNENKNVGYRNVEGAGHLC